MPLISTDLNQRSLIALVACDLSYAPDSVLSVSPGNVSRLTTYQDRRTNQTLPESDRLSVQCIQSQFGS
jgi:hypothetical protein